MAQGNTGQPVSLSSFPGFQAPCSCRLSCFDSAIAFVISSLAGVSVGVLLFCVCMCGVPVRCVCACVLVKGVTVDQLPSCPAHCLLMASDGREEGTPALFLVPIPPASSSAHPPGRGRQVILPAT